MRNPGQPYNVAPWFYNGTEGSGFDSGGDLGQGNAGYPDTVVDWVLVWLRETPTGEALCKAAALLHNDGRIEFIDSVFECCDLDMSGTYYLVIEHRNHLRVMSHEPLEVVGDTITYDFRDKQSYRQLLFLPDTYVGFGQKEILPGMYAMFAGNGEQDTDEAARDINVYDNTFWFNRMTDFDNAPAPGEDPEGFVAAYDAAGDYNLDGDISVHDNTVWYYNNDMFTMISGD